MDPTKPSDVRSLLATLDFKPSKVLGQNFLIDANIIDIIIKLSDIQPDDVVLEIGPGLGALTAPLVARAKRVIAVEKDDVLAKHIAAYFPHATHLELRHQDALDLDYQKLFSAEGVRKVISNLPYSVGSRMLMEIFACSPGPDRIVVTVQEEVADRLAAKPSTKDYGLLGICAQVDFEPKIGKIISPNCFLPPPQIRSAVVVLERRKEARSISVSRVAFRDLVRRLFSHRRKQMQSSLSREFPHISADRRADALRAAGADDKDRPENLTVDQWLRLAAAILTDR